MDATEKRLRVVRAIGQSIDMMEDWLNGDFYTVDGRGMYKRLLETSFDATDYEINELVKRHPRIFPDLQD